MKMMMEKVVVLLSLFILVSSFEVNIVKRVQEVGEHLQSKINTRDSSHVEKLINAVHDDKSGKKRSGTAVIVDFIVSATPSTASSVNSAILGSISSTGGSCRIASNGWKILANGIYYTNFYIASVWCNSASSYSSLAGNPSFSSNVLSASLASGLENPLGDKMIKNHGDVSGLAKREIRNKTLANLIEKNVEKNKEALERRKSNRDRLKAQEQSKRLDKRSTQKRYLPEDGPFVDNFENQCNVGDNYNWYLDGLDGVLDCNSITDPKGKNCKYMTDHGNGATYIMIDTGIMRLHPEFASKTSSNLQQICINPDEYHNPTGPDCLEDYHSHGTTMAGYMVGDTLGVTKNAKLVSMKAFDRNMELTEAVAANAFQTAQDMYVNSLVTRPAMVVSSLNFVYEKATCNWVDVPWGSWDPSMCGYQVVSSILEMISKGLIMSNAMGNGWKNTRDYGGYDWLPMGYDFCSYERFSWAYDVEATYFPMVLINGRETPGKSGIRPFRIGTADQHMQPGRWFEMQTDGVQTSLVAGASHWGNDPDCMDYVAPGIFLNNAAVLPGVIYGQNDHTIDWTDRYYPGFEEPLQYVSAGIESPPSGYLRTPWKQSASSWANAIGSAAIMIHMLEKWPQISAYSSSDEMSDKVRLLVDQQYWVTDYYGFTWFNSRIWSDWENENQDTIFRYLLGDDLYYEFFPAEQYSRWVLYKLLKIQPLPGHDCSGPKERVIYLPESNIMARQSNTNNPYGPDEFRDNWPSTYDADKLTECQRYWPNTVSTRIYVWECVRTAPCFYQPGSLQPCYEGCNWSYECVQP